MNARNAIIAAAWLVVAVVGVGAQEAKLTFNGNDGLSICDSDGKNVAKFTLPLPKRLKDNFSGPVRSPDGTKIAFYGSPEKGDGFFIADADGKNAKRLTDDPDSYHTHICWFPDGKQLVCAEFEGDGERIWLLHADGTAPTALTKEKMFCECPSVSPDGTKIALIQGKRVIGKGRGVVVMDTDGKNLKQIHGLHKNGYAGKVAWSPDGGQLLFNDVGDLYVMNPDGSGVKKLTSLGGIGDLAWSPDGKLIAFIRCQNGSSEAVTDNAAAPKFDIYVMNADGSNPKAVVKDLITYTQPGWWVP